mgnify:CR=1 FL=1
MKLNELVECADGFTMSVQAHEGAYCSPRMDNAEKYTAVEVGFPSREEPLLLDFAEDSDQPTMTVYGWVPAKVVVNVIAKHGGMVDGEIPRGIAPLRASAR